MKKGIESQGKGEKMSMLNTMFSVPPHNITTRVILCFFLPHKIRFSFKPCQNLLKHENRRDNARLHFRLVFRAFCISTQNPFACRAMHVHRAMHGARNMGMWICMCVHRMCTFMPLYSIPAIVCVLMLKFKS